MAIAPDKELTEEEKIQALMQMQALASLPGFIDKQTVRFGNLMKARLKEPGNISKGKWTDYANHPDNIHYCFQALIQNATKANRAWLNKEPNEYVECLTDVANYAMILADALLGECGKDFNKLEGKEG